MVSLEQAIEILNENYKKHIWDENPAAKNDQEKMITQWPGAEDEEIVISVHKDVGIFQKFHRHDFFFINFALQGDFHALSQQNDHQILIREGQVYMAQPHSGYAVVAKPDQPNTIAAILIQRKAFFREYFSVLSRTPELFRFFLQAENNPYSEQSLLIDFDEDEGARELVELMCRAYADPDDSVQDFLKALVLSLLILIADRIHAERMLPNRGDEPLLLILRKIQENSQTVSLDSLAREFGYHPSYLSSLIKKETGKTFSMLVLEQRMNNALLMLQHSGLTIEEISSLSGYTNPSNFYKSFRSVYGVSPRQYLKEQQLQTGGLQKDK